MRLTTRDAKQGATSEEKYTKPLANIALPAAPRRTMQSSDRRELKTAL
jgi:hypothetical protein